MAPVTELQRRVAEIWASVLELDRVGLEDNFFELGGDSLTANRLSTELESVLGRDIPSRLLLDAPTVLSLCERLNRTQAPISLFALGPLRAGLAQTRPLFCVYGLSRYQALAEHLGADVQTFGIYVRPETFDPPSDSSPLAVDSRLQRLPTIQRLASRYIEEIRAIQPSGPYQLSGWSFGGLVAFEMAQQLTSAGDHVRFLGLIDAFTRDSHRAVSPRAWPYLFKTRVRYAAARYALLERALFDANNIAKHMRNKERSKYEAKPYAGKAIVYRSEEGIRFPGFKPDPACGWGKVVVGGLEVHVVPGDHIGMLAEPNARQLAHVMKPYLDLDAY